VNIWLISNWKGISRVRNFVGRVKQFQTRHEMHIHNKKRQIISLLFRTMGENLDKGPLLNHVLREEL
jgi:hypothetical protein